MLRRVLAAFAASLALFAAPVPALADGPQVSEAQSAIVIDEMGQELWGLDPDLRTDPASLTKVMTAMVALDSGLDLDAPCTVHPIDLGEYSQDIGYREQDTPSLREMLDVMLIFSANDAAYQIAMNVAGSEAAFVELMNAKAAEIGMTGTAFANPHGLDQAGHYSCARDLANMGRYALRNYPLIAYDVRQESVRATVGGNSFWVDSTDEMMGTYEGLIGIKTGKTISNTTAFLGAAERDGVRVYTCVLGCATDEGRFDDTRALMDWTFGHYRDFELPSQAPPYAWVPYAFDFRLVCPLEERPAARSIADTGEGAVPLAYSTSRLYRGTLLHPGQTVRATLWTQGERVVCASWHETGRPMLRRSAVPMPEGRSIDPEPLEIAA